jgi:hypothetical protein
MACSVGPDPDEPLASTTGALTPPDSLCTSATFGGHTYWFCNNLRNWQTARSRCEAVGLNLVRIDSEGENDFIRTQIAARLWLFAWTGANDRAVEGAWRWSFGGSQFWSGAANGSPIPGMYSRWKAFQPDNFINQDCAQINLDGTWSDESCGNILSYVCESGIDLCQDDPQKVEFGVCGCGVPDVDSDGDGVFDCEDRCPHDPTKIAPGHCGCADNPRPAGTACNDGLCDANTECNGAGVCGDPAQCPPPDSHCRHALARNTYYWFCDRDRPFFDARQRCQSVGMDLATVQSEFEDAFIGANMREHSFLGATDQAVEGDWVWFGAPLPFWTGGPAGSPVAGAYTNWKLGEPSDGLLGRDCLAKHVLGDQKWIAHPCSFSDAFVCEREFLPPVRRSLDLLDDPHLGRVAQAANLVGEGAITRNPHAPPGQEVCEPGLDLVTRESGDMEWAPYLEYPDPPGNPDPNDPDCRIVYEECSDPGNTNRASPAESALNQPATEADICEEILDRSIEECGIDESTIDLSPNGLCTAHAQCIGRGFVCALVCTDAACDTQEHRCAFPKPGCFGLLEEENCLDVRECAEEDYTGESDPDTPGSEMEAHPPGDMTRKADAPEELTQVQEHVLPPYPPTTSACRIDEGPTLELPLQSEERGINVGNEKWGLYVTPLVEWRAKAEPLPLGESRLDVLAHVAFEVGAHVWGHDVKLLNVSAQAELERGHILEVRRVVDVLGVSIDPGQRTGDRDSERFSGLDDKLIARHGLASAMKQAQTNAIAVKEYYEQFGATTRLCTALAQGVRDFNSTCDTNAELQAAVRYWFDKYEAAQTALLANQVDIDNERQALVSQIPNGRLPIFNDQRRFTAFNHDFTYPVGPVTVTIEIDIGGSWGASGGLELRAAPPPASVFVSGDIRPTAQATAFAFAGVGFGPVSFGIAGDLLLIGAQAPLLAEASLEQAASPDTRDHRYFSELELLPSPAFPPMKHEWTGAWAYGSRPELQTLNGQIDLAARVNLFFYKKTFRKKLAEWSGPKRVYEFVSRNGQPLQGSPRFGTFGADAPFVDPVTLRILRNPSAPNVNTDEVPAWALDCGPLPR